MLEYHDKEWGVPVHDDRKWFEFIILDAFQAGLSWKTVLNKRENFRKAFDGFDPAIVAHFDETRIQALLQDPGIIRNRLKVRAAVENAKAFLALQKEFGSFDTYIWGFTCGQVVDSRLESLRDMPARTELSDRISKDMVKRGFKFVGSTIVYAFLQAAGVVNDHLVTCFRYQELREGRYR
jgi:DNA-3-methyladenine glycosylase I